MGLRGIKFSPQHRILWTSFNFRPKLLTKLQQTYRTYPSTLTPVTGIF
jgi:hypothetical protein